MSNLNINRRYEGETWRGSRGMRNRGSYRMFSNRGRTGSNWYPYENQLFFNKVPEWQKGLFPLPAVAPPEIKKRDIKESWAQSLNNVRSNKTRTRNVDNTTGNFATNANNSTADPGGEIMVEESIAQNDTSSPQNEEDTAKGSAMEIDQVKKSKKNTLIIRFPDPEITKDVVKNFHPGIEKIHFQIPCAARYCIVYLADDVDPDEVIKDLSQVNFGGGKLMVEKKVLKGEAEASDTFTGKVN